MTVSVCPRCGKTKHSGSCTFDKTKKSLIESAKDDIENLKKPK